jgi:hypothetical protein
MEVSTMDAKTIAWIKQALANDEASSDEELLEHFVKKGDLSRDEAARWVALRPQYLREVFCDIEPDEQIDEEQPYQLPTFKGYTVDMRLREFRKATLGKKLEFILFNSPEGNKLLEELKSFAQEIISFEIDR